MTDAGPGFDTTTFSHGGRTHEVYVASPGPGGLPHVPVPPVAGELAGDVQRHGKLEHIEAAVFARSRPDARRRERRRRPLPQLPPAGRVEARAFLAGPERAQVVGTAQHA